MDEINGLDKKNRLHHRYLQEYKNKRDNVLSGGINCIPSPLKRFRREFPGIERAKNYIVTANSKVGKTQITDYLFVLSVLMYAYNNPGKIKVKILYFSLEMSIQEKMSQWTCFWLYMHTSGRIRIDTKQLNSLNEEKPLSTEVLELMESKEYNKFFDFLEDCIIFNETDRSPSSIYNKSIDFALRHGQIKYKNEVIKVKESKFNPETSLMEDVYVEKVVREEDRYIPNDPDLYIIKLTDHVSLFEHEKGMNLRDTMTVASAQYNVRLRNIYGFTNVDIQQQAADKEGNEAFKLDRITPSPDGLGDNKTTQRDCNVMIGLFSPFRMQKDKWENYNIVPFKDNIRFLEICLNRSGSAGAVCPLYFDGAVNFFAELPYPNDPKLKYFEDMAFEAQK